MFFMLLLTTIMEDYIKIAKQIIELRTTHNHPSIIQKGLDVCEKYFDNFPVIIKKYKNNGVSSLLILNQDTLQPDILLLGHLDVADGADDLFKLKIKDDKITGRGTSDMKAFVASNLYVMKQVLQSDFKGTIGCAIVTDEETGGTFGTKYLVEKIGLQPKVVLVPDDGDNIDTIVTDSKHILSWQFTATGKSAHGNRPWDGINAIELLIKTHSNLRKIFPEQTSKPENNWINTMNLGIINGGFAANEVPREAVMNVDIRIVPPTTKEEINQKLKDALVEGVKLELIAEAKPTIVNQKDENFRRYCSIVKKHCGKIYFKKSGGGTDARYFSPKNTSIIIHQGVAGDAQGENEYVELSSIKKLTDIQLEFILGTK